MMNSAEKKLDLFRKIDRLDNRDLEKIYNQLISLMDTASAEKTSLSQELKEALGEALDARKKGHVFTNEEVMSLIRVKYSNLFK